MWASLIQLLFLSFCLPNVPTWPPWHECRIKEFRPFTFLIYWKNIILPTLKHQNDNLMVLNSHLKHEYNLCHLFLLCGTMTTFDSQHKRQIHNRNIDKTSYLLILCNLEHLIRQVPSPSGQVRYVSLSVATKIFEDFWRTLFREFIIGWKPVLIVHYTMPGICINPPLH